MSRAWHERRWGRFFLEYVGNIDVASPEGNDVPARVERRTNHHGRELVEWFKRELADRRLAPEKKIELLNGMREAVRAGDGRGADSRLAEEVDRE